MRTEESLYARNPHYGFLFSAFLYSLLPREHEDMKEVESGNESVTQMRKRVETTEAEEGKEECKENSKRQRFRGRKEDRLRSQKINRYVRREAWLEKRACQLANGPSIFS